MISKRLTKKQINKATAMELTIRMNQLYTIDKARPEDAGIPIVDIREAVAINTELRSRLLKLLRPSVALEEILK